MFRSCPSRKTVKQAHWHCRIDRSFQEAAPSQLVDQMNHTEPRLLDASSGTNGLWFHQASHVFFWHLGTIKMVDIPLWWNIGASWIASQKGYHPISQVNHCWANYTIFRHTIYPRDSFQEQNYYYTSLQCHLRDAQKRKMNMFQPPIHAIGSLGSTQLQAWFQLSEAEKQCYERYALEAKALAQLGGKTFWIWDVMKSLNVDQFKAFGPEMVKPCFWDSRWYDSTTPVGFGVEIEVKRHRVVVNLWDLRIQLLYLSILSCSRLMGTKNHVVLGTLGKASGSSFCCQTLIWIKILMPVFPWRWLVACFLDQKAMTISGTLFFCFVL